MASENTFRVSLSKSHQLTDSSELTYSIVDISKPSNEKFYEPFSGMTFRFDQYRDTSSSSDIIIVSIEAASIFSKYEAVATCRRQSCNSTEVKKTSASGRCLLQLSTSYSDGASKSATISVKITKTKSTRFQNKPVTYLCLAAAEEVTARQKKLTTELYNNRDSTGDVKIVTANGTELKAHKLVLGTQSSFFKAMFDADMKERRDGTVKIDKFDDELVRSMIEFMYVGWTGNVHMNPEALLKIAHMYQVQDLIEACWKVLLTTLKVNNAVKLLLLADKFDDEDGSFKKKVGKFLLVNTEAISGTEEYADLIKKNPDIYLSICVSE